MTLQRSRRLSSPGFALVSWLALGAGACSGDVSKSATQEKSKNNAGGSADASGRGGHGMVDEGPPIPVGDEFACEADLAQAAPGQTRRLSRIEMANVIDDLFGLDVTNAIDKMPDADETVRAFNNLGLLSSSDHTVQFEELALDVSAKVNVNDYIAKYAKGCKALGKDCEERFINNMGRMVLRGPVSDTERDALMGIYAEAAKQDVGFADASHYVLQGLLQSPRFIYRFEDETGDGDDKDLGAYDLANRLSFAIWQSGPDEALLDAAADGGLDKDTGIKNQVDRMLADPRAGKALASFLDDWMDLHRFKNGQSIKEKYQDFDPGLLTDMRDETRALFEKVVTDGLPIGSIYNHPSTTVSARLAAHYGFEDPQDGVAQYDLSDVKERGGLLTQGIMNSLGGVDGSTVRTGLHILHEVLCGEMADPPPGLNVEPVPPTPGASVRVVSEERVDDQLCGACHSQFEPLVWGLVRYRPTGHYDAKDIFDNELAEDGFVIFPDDVDTKHEYNGPAEMMDILADSDRVRDCALLKTATFIHARTLREGDACSLKQARDALDDGASFRDLLRAIVTSKGFRRIRSVSL